MRMRTKGVISTKHGTQESKMQRRRKAALPACAFFGVLSIHIPTIKALNVGLNVLCVFLKVHFRARTPSCEIA